MSSQAFISDINLQWKKNNARHHTDMFRDEQLIVRRGQPFVIKLSLGCANDMGNVTQAQLLAETGPHPSVSSGTCIIMDLTTGAPSSGWSTSVSQEGTAVSLTIYPASDAPIGKYSLNLKSRACSTCKTPLGEFVLLFNPWCADDSVYMENIKEREEYVMSQDGLIYRGSACNIRPMPWNFGQFQSGILNVCLKILDRSLQHRKNPDKDCSQRNDPIYVTRVLSAMINADDDQGVLVGNWGKNIDNGVNPCSWTGSVAILRRWHDGYCQSVRYGQCWVFAAVDCTVSRALGIPCRMITNFQSAHDTNGDLKIELFMDEDGNRRKDTVWNFHCWVESWMKRPDLKPGYDGWQASDPTPQEQSEGVMCCGPVPVKAIKEGDLTCKYDAAFVYAEVNAVIITKERSNNGSVVDVVDKVKVGQNISTKSVGQDTRNDVTHLYKYEEGSSMEDKSFKNAQVCQNFDLTIKSPSKIKKGSDLVLHTTVENKSSAAKMITLHLSCSGLLHGGLVDNECSWNQREDYTLNPGKKVTVPIQYKYSTYANLLCSTSQLQVFARLIDKTTQTRMMEKHIVTLDDPEITIELLCEPIVGRQNCAKLSMMNPLSETLDDCCFTVQGSGLTNGETIIRRIPCVDPGQTARALVYFTPTRYGQRKLMVDFYSKNLGHVKAFTNLNIST